MEPTGVPVTATGTPVRTPTAPAAPGSQEGSGAGVLLETVVTAGAVGVIASGYGSLFADAGMRGVAAASAALPVLLASGARARGWRIAPAVAASVGLFAVWASLAALVDTLAGGVFPTADTAHGLLDGLFQGWRLLLDAILPVGDEPAIKVFVLAVCWTAGLTSGELGARSRLVAHPMLPAVALAALLLLLRAPLGDPSAVAVAAGIVAVLSIPLVRAAPERVLAERRGGERDHLTSFHTHGVAGRRLGAGLPIALVAVGLAVAVTAAASLGSGDGFDPRDLRDPQVEVGETLNPLTELKSILLEDPAVPALTVEFAAPDAALEVVRIPAVRLDRFDGAVWTSGGSYRRTGADIRLDPPGDVGSITAEDALVVEADVRLEEAIGRWLPAPGAIERIDATADLLVDPATGNLLPAAGTVDGYRTRSVIVNPTSEERRQARVATGPAVVALSRLDAPLPAELQAVVAEATGGTTDPFAALEALERWLATTVVHDPSSPSGHSYARLVDAVAGSRRGYAEQTASAFAVMARSLGFPARVVVGFRLVDVDDEGRVTPSDDITSAQVHAWSEVLFEGLGWVPFDPAPMAQGDAAGETPALQGPGTTVATGEVLEQRPESGPEQAGPSETDPEDESAGFGTLLRIVAAATVGLLLLAVLVTVSVLVAKRVRRRRRQSSDDPAERILGAWDEALDRLAETGVPLHPGMTLTEITHAASNAVGRATALPFVAMVPEVRRTIFAAEAPSEQAAEQAWLRVAEFEDGLRQELGTLRSIRTQLDPRTLRRR
jgi:transglutaminase-like putative cysteine protease